MSFTNEDKQFIQDLFSHLDRRLDRLEARIDKLEGRIYNLETRFDTLEKKVDKLDMKIDMTRADVRLLMANLEVNTDRINEMHVDVKMIRNDTDNLKEDRDHTFSLIVPKQSEHEKRIMHIEGMLLSDSKKV